MKYRVLIFMAKERLSAVDVDADGKADDISINGNDMMLYTSKEQIREFSLYLKNYYNIDSFSELEMAFLVIKFDAVMENVHVLLEEIKDAAECNLVSVEKLLPWMAFKERMLKANIEVQMKAFDIVYTVSMDSNMAMKCRIGGTGEQAFILSADQFARYNCLGKDSLFGCEEEIEKLHTQVKELERQLQEEKYKAETAENTLQRIVSKIYEMRDKKECNVRRNICRIKCTDQKKEDCLCERGKYVLKVKFCNDNTEIVKKDQIIARVSVDEKKQDYGSIVGSVLVSRVLTEAINNAYSLKDLDFVIKATCDGRIFWLQESETEVVYGSDVAIIGDLSDTKEDVMKWYGKNK